MDPKDLLASMPSESATTQRPALNRILLVVVLVWCALVATGLLLLWTYSATPGAAGNAPDTWPKVSRIHHNGRFELVVFAHPMSPCTRASLAELARLLAVCDDQVETHVVLISPNGADASWRDSDLVRQARQIRGVDVLLDENRHEANLFHVRTSGCCLLYDPAGKIVFRGGLTVARGHEGDSDGSRALFAVLGGDKAVVARSPVFGCPLFESETSNSRIAKPAN